MRTSRIALASVTLLTFMTIGCARKQVAIAPPPPPPPVATTPAVAATPTPVAQVAKAKPTTESLVSQFNRMISDIYFDYDKYDVRPDQKPLIEKAADFLGSHPDLQVTIEGHCDSRGSEEYNLALGDSRANSVKTALIAAGANQAQFKTVSYGKEKPFCTEESEACWAQNRRDHYVRSGN
jgi:peptidoglycan-associated lipoprotein